MSDLQDLPSVTNTQLLEALRRPDPAGVWPLFDRRYRPMLLRYARRMGLGASDAEDVAQNALMGFVRSYRDGLYDRTRGRLHDWLFSITRREIANFRRAARRVPGPLADADAPEPRDEAADLRLWEEEWRRAVLDHCAEIVRAEVEPRTFEAFELFARHGKSAAEVGALLDLTESAVFNAKRRILRRIRELLPGVEDSF